MLYYYCVRYNHNSDKETEYYTGNGIWATRQAMNTPNERVSIRMYRNEKLAMQVIKDMIEADWFCVDLIE